MGRGNRQEAARRCQLPLELCRPWDPPPHAWAQTHTLSPDVRACLPSTHPQGHMRAHTHMCVQSLLRAHTHMWGGIQVFYDHYVCTGIA